MKRENSSSIHRSSVLFVVCVERARRTDNSEFNKSEFKNSTFNGIDKRE